MYELCFVSEGGMKYSNINMCILYFICKDMRPFNVVEGEGFLKLIKELAPYYKVPSSTHFKKLLCDKYDVEKMKYVSRISNATELCVTADIWTETMNEKSFLGVTVHFLEKTTLTSSNIATRELQSNHTAEYISYVLGDILKDWDIPLSKVTCAVTDNGSNMVAAIKKTLGDSKYLPCFAHTINLIVDSSIKSTSTPISDIISKVREIVKWVKNSVIQSDKLRKIQIDSGVAEGCTKKFILDVKTRWNSLYYMMDRFLDMSKIASQLLLDDIHTPELVTGQEIEILKQVVQLLQPFEFVTRESSGQNYVTLSKIIPMINCLTSQLTSFSSSIECVTQLKTKLLAECKKRFGLIEFNTLAAFATILDPRFKNLHFQDASACGRAIQKLNNLIKEDTTMSTSGSEEETPNEDFDFWLHHKQLAVGQKRRRANSKADEVSIYLANPVCALKGNPLEEWEDLKPVFPALYKQARIFLNIVGTSVPCERLFSKAGATVTASRNRLKGKHLEKLLFLGSTTKTDFFS